MLYVVSDEHKWLDAVGAVAGVADANGQVWLFPRRQGQGQGLTKYTLGSFSYQSRWNLRKSRRQLAECLWCRTRWTFFIFFTALITIPTTFKKDLQIFKDERKYYFE